MTDRAPGQGFAIADVSVPVRGRPGRVHATLLSAIERLPGVGFGKIPVVPPPWGAPDAHFDQGPSFVRRYDRRVHALHPVGCVS